MKTKKCKICGNDFKPFRTTQKVCSGSCAIEYAKVQEKAKKRKKIRKWQREKRIELMTHKDWLKKLQVIFNRYIRDRDKDKPCVSCGKPLIGKFDAGHFYSVGSTPELRFNEDNVHGQCVECNQHLHGNLIEYAERLPGRIGPERFERLKEAKNKSKKLTIPEIRDLIEEYKTKLKR